MNELSILFGIILLLVITIGLLIAYGDKNHKVLWFSFFILSFASYLTIYAY